ncbi:MAG: ABC transporter permease [Lachnospiraceae bacterium]|nr:ABC transporter permease [Lachnospiraceae bacterium]
MIVKNSIRQLWRTKGRAALFFLLLLLASGLLSLGRGFQVINDRNIQTYQDGFMTIGTVEQKSDTIQEILEWDAEIKDYHIYNRSVYDSCVPLSVLDFEGADYVSGPEKRVFYGAYNPDYQMYEGLDRTVIVEATPLEDVIPDHPVTLTITRVLSGSGLWEGLNITFCNHYDPQPEMLYAGRIYIMSLQNRPGHESEKQFEEDMKSEYAPWPVLESKQVGPNGEEVADDVEKGAFYAEVTEGFYDTPEGRRWMNLLETWDYTMHIFPVTGTDNIHLMMAFYNGDVWISSGREFTEEEYEAGEKVCLISERFALKNDLHVGDGIRLPLLYANHRWPAGRQFGNNGLSVTMLLNAKGEIYPVFEDSMYMIVGLYSGTTGLRDEYGLAFQEILIPGRSVKNSDEDNIVAYGPMLGSTTSFQIENGTIQEYLEKWNRLGIDNVEITFYDGGYTQMEAGIENMKYIARILVCMGIVMVLMVLFYFTWLFIIRQGERTAVERCLGLSRKKCFLSLFSGLFLLMTAGITGGCMAGSAAAAQIAGSIRPANYYDSSFSNGKGSGVETEGTKEDTLPVSDSIWLIAGLLLFGSLISSTGIWLNLKAEPVELLAKKGE